MQRSFRHSWLLLLACASGCASGRGDLWSDQNRLSDAAKQQRLQAAAIMPRELAKHPMQAYVLEPGDGLLIQPADPHSELRLPSDQTILPDGTIDLGEYGTLPVAGKTLQQLQTEVQQLITAKKSDAGFISVRLVNRTSKVFYVLGEVNTPGSLPLSGRETVLDAILAAGGLTERASTRNIILTRPTLGDAPRIVLSVCYDEIVQLGDTTTNYQLQAGDRVYVPARMLCEKLEAKKKPCPGCDVQVLIANKKKLHGKDPIAKLGDPVPLEEDYDSDR